MRDPKILSLKDMYLFGLKPCKTKAPLRNEAYNKMKTHKVKTRKVKTHKVKTPEKRRQPFKTKPLDIFHLRTFQFGR